MKKNSNIKKRILGKISQMLLLAILLLTLPLSILAQTTVFYDDFNRTTATVLSGGTPTMTYSATNTGGGTQIIESTLATGTVPYLKISNGTPAGRSYLTGPLSTFSSPFNATLTSNTGLVTWSFNARHNRNSTLSGFIAGNYGFAIVLVASSSDLSSANGYAVVSGGSSSNVYRLVKFTGGLYADAGVTNLVTGLTQTDRRDYMGIKVTYDKITGTWSYYDRTDGPSGTPAWADPSAGTYTLRGTSTNADYTGTTMTSFGFLWNYSTSAGNNAYVDNFRVQVTIPAPTWTSGWPKSESATQTGFTAKVNSSAIGNAYYVVLPSAANPPTSAQVKAGQDNTGTAVAANRKGTITVSAAATEYTAAVSGLTGGTTYDVYYVAEDGTPNLQSTPVKVSVTTTPAAAWTSGWPKAETPTPTGFTAKVNTNVAGTAYYVVLSSGATAPTSAQVKAGNDNSDSPATKSGSISCVAGATEYTAAVTGLSGGTNYDVYYVAQDGSAILMASPTLVTVTTTSSALVPSISLPTATTFTNNSALLGGDITSDGGSSITERGTVWKASSGVTISDNLLAEGGTSTGVFTHTRSSLPAKSQIFYKGYAINAIGTTLTSESSFYTLANEPTAQVTGFSATPTSSTSINLTWTAAEGVEGYIVLKKQGSSAPTGTPTDANTYTVGNTIGDGTVAAVITTGSANSQSIGGLTALTAYSFAIYAVNSDDTNAGTYNYYLTSAPTATGTTPAAPALSSAPSTLTGFGYIAGSGPSTSQSFNLSGTNLTGYPGNITVSGTTDYDVSTDNSSFSSSATVAFTSGTLSSTPVYVRLKAGLSAANYNSEVVASTGGGAASVSNVTCSGTVVPAPTTYTWNQTGTASFATPANWNPTRTTPATNDILVFNGGGSIVASGLTTQTIAQLQISNSTTVELQSSGTATLTIAGSLGTDLDIQSGSALNLAQATVITIAVGTGATGSIAGTISFTTAAHKLTSADASGITFQSGSSFTAGTGFSSNAFGTTSLNSIVFASGSKYFAYAGANPFGATAPSSVVVWQPGSTFVLKNTGAPSLGSRTYANFEMDEATGASLTSSSALTMDNLIITSGTWSLGIKALHTINGSISVASGATLNLNPATTAGTITLKGDINVTGTLNVNPSSTTEAITFSGTSVQNIYNTGTLNNATGSSYIIANSTGVNIASNVTIPTLTVNSGGILNVNVGKQLTVGTTLSNSGTMNLLSDATGTATILTPASISGTGTSTVQQYLTTGRNWYISSPVTGATAAVFNPEGLSNKLYWYDEAHGSSTMWPQITSNATGLTVMQGYVANMATDGAVTFSGTLNSGSKNITVNRTAGQTKEGFNLVGNPFASYLNWDMVTKSVSLQTSIWQRTKNGDTYVFDTYNSTGQQYINNSGIGTNNHIPPMQAFWVRVDNGQTSGSLTVDNTMRTHKGTGLSVTDPVFKSHASVTQSTLRLQVSNGTITDEAVIYSNSGASNNFDAYDSPKMFNNSVSIAEIYTVAGNEEVAINGLNSIPNDTEIPLGFTTVAAGSFSIKASQISNFDPGTQIILKDYYADAKNPVIADLSDGSSYSFTSGATSNNLSRFTLIFHAPSVATGISTVNGNVWISTNGNGQLMINGTVNGETSVAVYNAIGQRVANKNLTSNVSILDTRLVPGVYTVTLTSLGKTATTKVIIK